MPLNEYMALPRFDAGRYAAIPANHTVQVAGVRVSARSEAWRRRWLHCRHIQDVHDPCDLEFLRTSHEGLYQARLASLFRSISERGWQEDSTPKAPHIELLCYGREAFHGIYWTKNRKVFGEDASSESRIRHRWLRPRYDWPCPTMFTWDATGSYFKVPFDLRFQYYPQGFPAWKDYETPEYLCVPTPAVYAYLGSHTCNTKPTAVDDIRIRFIHSIALTEFAAYALYSWLLAARDGIQFNCRSPDPRMYQQGYEMYPPGRLFFLPPALTSLIEGLGLNSLLAGSEFTMQDARACATAMASDSFLPSRDFAFFDWRSKHIVPPRPEHVSPLGGEYRLVPTFGKTHSPSGVAITSDIGEPSLPAPEPIAAPPALTSLPLPVHQPPASSATPVAVSAPVTNPPAIPTTSVPVPTTSSATPAAPVASSPMPVVSAPVVVTSQPPTSTAMDDPAASAPLPVSSAPPSVSQPQGGVFQPTGPTDQASATVSIPTSAPAGASDPIGDVPLAPSIPPTRVATPVPRSGVPVTNALVTGAPVAVSIPANRAASSSYDPYDHPYNVAWRRRLQEADPYADPYGTARRRAPSNSVDPYAPLECSVGPERRSDYYEVADRALRMDADDRQRDPERYERIVNSAFLDMVRACEDTERDPPTGVAEALAMGAMATRELNRLARQIRLWTDAARSRAEDLEESASYADRTFFQRKRRRQ